MQMFFKFLLEQIKSYFTVELIGKIKEAFFKGLKALKETMWNALKDEFHTVARSAVAHVEEFLTSEEARAKEELVLDRIMEKVKLPVLARPFKGMIRKMLKDKLEGLVVTALGKGKEFVA